MLFLKISFFIMYLQIFGPLRWLRLCAYAGVIFTIISYGVMTVLSFIFASPRRGQVLFQKQTSAKARDAKLLSIPQSVIGLVVDLAILLLPIIAVLQLQLPRRKQVGVILVFMTGIL